MDPSLLDILTCPSCKSELHFNAKEEVLVCKADRLAFALRNDKPIMLVDEAQVLSAEQMKSLTSN